MAFNVDVFPFAEPLAFWSSTPDNNDVSDFSNYSLMVANGAIWNETRTVALPVLMVRGGQP
jgi:hypothetical protein